MADPDPRLPDLDPRLNAFRPDLADARLRGRVKAERYVEPERRVVAAPVAPLRRRPAPDAPLETEALHGEVALVLEWADEGWAWTQIERDSYVGWMPAGDLVAHGAEPTHRVVAPRTLVFPGPDIKVPPIGWLPMGALVAVRAEAEDANARYYRIVPTGAVVVQHLAPRRACAPDFVTVAESLMGAPYLWGGRTSLGIDCSGLVQLALEMAGLSCPRDTDMQAAGPGALLAADIDAAGRLPELRRGDLVFWPGHVGIMRDGERLLHANAHHMAVAGEPLSEARRRLAERGVAITAVRRVL